MANKKDQVTAGVWWDREAAGGKTARSKPTSFPWHYELRWVLQDDRLECVGVELRSDYGIGPGEARPMTAALLRRFPVGTLMAEARQRGGTPELAVAGFQLHAKWQAKSLDAARAWEQSHAGRPGPKGYGADHFAEVARIYREEARVSNRPTRAVATRFQVSESAAAKQVARARAMGLLPTARKGKAG